MTALVQRVSRSVVQAHALKPSKTCTLQFTTKEPAILKEQLSTPAGLDGFMFAELRFLGQILTPHEILLRLVNCQFARPAAVPALDHFSEFRQAQK